MAVKKAKFLLLCKPQQSSDAQQGEILLSRVAAAGGTSQNIAVQVCWKTMSQPAPKRRGRPARKAPQTEEQRLASQRARSQRYYQRQHEQAVISYRAPTEPQQAEFIHHHYQPHPPAIPSTTDPVVGLHLEPHLQIPTPVEDPLPAESTYNRDYDEPSETEAGPAAAPPSCNPPVWRHEENSRTNHPSPVDGQEHHPLFEDSQAQLELASQGCDAADAAFVQDQIRPSSQFDARDEELQTLVDTVQQLLITPDREATTGKKGPARGFLCSTVGTIDALTRVTRRERSTTIVKDDGTPGRPGGMEPSICRLASHFSRLSRLSRL